MPPATTCWVAGSSAIWPAVKMRFPRRIAWEYGPMAAGACAVAIFSFAMEELYRVAVSQVSKSV